jgi:uncharacterized membrane protein (UPF0127 family)
MPMNVARVLTSEGHLVCPRCVVADRPLRRMKGLLGRSDLPEGEGILLRPAGSVHTFFMRFPIDCVYLDKSLKVVAVAAAVPPWRVRGARGARAVLELRAGEAERVGIGAGMQLRLEANPSNGG